MFRSCGRVIAVLVCGAALAGVTWGQGTRATISGVEGFYTFPDVVAGGYDLTVAAKGFHEYIQRGISVNLDQQVRIDVSLELGATAETIEVTANASPLNFDSAVKKGTIQPG